MSLRVNGDNFARAESDRMFASFQADAGGVDGSLTFPELEPV